MAKIYKYELHINGVLRKEKTNQFRPNIVADMISDLEAIGTHTEEVVFKIKRMER